MTAHRLRFRLERLPMPERMLTVGERLLLGQVTKPVTAKTIKRTLRPFAQSLYHQGLVALRFDWEAFDVLASITEKGLARLERDRQRRQTDL